MRLKPASFGLAATFLAGISLMATTSADVGAPQYGAGTATPQAEAVTFYGSMEINNSWTQTPKVGIYEFASNGEPDDYKAVSETQTGRLVTGGGAYAEGYFYYINGVETSDKDHISNTFNKVDPETWKVVRTSGHNAPTKTDAYTLAYDYITSTMYAYCPTRDNGNPGYVLRKVDLETGECTDVAQVPGSLYINAMAFDANGQLWGIERRVDQTSARLHKINKATGATTLVGELGHFAGSDYAGAVFDFRTGKLYWASICFTVNQYQERHYTSYLMEVDTATGKAEPVKTFNNGEVFSSLFIKDCHPKAPESIADMGFNYSSGSDYKGKFAFTAPSHCYDRTVLSGTLKAEVYIDGQLAATVSGLAAGAAVTTDEITLAGGLHKVKAYCYDNNGRRSVAYEGTVWGGADVPGQVSGANVSVTPRGDVATITWEAPTASKNGGNCDLGDITYRIVRRPEGITVAEGLTERTFTDTPTRNMLLSQYEICAVAKAGAGDPVYTTPCLIGKAYSLPYLETFDNATQFNSYTLIDVNGIGCADGDRWMWYPQNREAIYWVNYNARNGADAWLVTPTIDLKQDDVYRFSFSTRGYASGTTTYTLSAHVGDLPTAEALDKEIFRISGEQPKQYENYHTFFVADEGECRIGLHLQNSGDDHCGIDNVRVAYYGPSTIPAAPEVTGTKKSGEKATIVVRIPNEDTRGRALASVLRLTLYRAGSTQPIATVDHPATGTEVEISDDAPVFGENNYVLTVTGSDGEGLEATASVNMRAPAPVAVESVSARTLSNGADVELSWQYPAGFPSATGEPLSESDITYDIYRNVGGVRTAIAQNIRGYSFTDENVTALYPDERQKWTNYYVVASTTGGKSAETTTSVLTGTTYELPFAESDFYHLTTSPWLSQPASSWNPGERGYEPPATPYKGYTMMRCMPSGSQQQRWISPRFNLSSLASLQLRFMLYCANLPEASAASLEIGLIRDVDGKEQPLELVKGSLRNCYSEESGWKEVVVDLSGYRGYSRASVVFVGHATNNYMIYVDDISLDGDLLAHDARLVALDGPSNCVRGRDNIYTATVGNNGTNGISGATVALLADGKVIDTKTVDLEPGQSASVDFTYHPELHGEEVPVVLSATVQAAADDNADNNSVSRDVMLVWPNVPYVDKVNASYDAEKGEVNLSWDEARLYPNAAAVKDDFEAYGDFIIAGIGEWTLHDGDGAATMGGITGPYGSYTWENCGLPQAYIVFNPRKIGIADLATAYSGEKCLVAVSAAAANDDWLISPQLIGTPQTVSFYTRAMNSYYLDETFEIWVSNSGNEVGDFTKLCSDRANSDTWMQKAYDLPDGTRYFAIRCTSNGQFGLMLDDIEYIPAQPAVDLMGYNVYRDGTRIAEGIGETMYTDAVTLTDKALHYCVSAVYADGESIYSDEATVSLSGIGDIAADPSVKVFTAPGKVIAQGAVGMPIMLASISGQVLYRFTGSGDDCLSVAPGNYVLRVGNHTYKLSVSK